eukprot:g13201.t1
MESLQSQRQQRQQQQGSVAVSGPKHGAGLAAPTTRSLTATTNVEGEGQLDDALAHQQRPRRRNGQEGGLSLTAARRRRRELELSWLEDPGRDVPFEFADLHEAMTLPCSIQLFPRVERRSLVYVDGKEARSYRGRRYTAATIPGAGSTKLNPARAATVAAAAATATATAVTIDDGSRREIGGIGDDSTGELGRGPGGNSSSGGGGGGIGLGGAALVAEAAAAAATGGGGEGKVEGEGVGFGTGQRRFGDAIRLVGEMDIDKPAYLQHRGWFYHKAVWVVLPGGKKVVLTARVHKPLFGQAEGELVLLEMPRVDHPLSEQNLPWREKVLATGPDVMFEVVDLDPDDSTVQVICAEFFSGRVTMHSLWGGGSLPGSSRPSVTESWVLDDNAGPAYSITAADLRGGSPDGRPTHFLVTTHESSYNTYSFFARAGAGGSGGSPSSADSAGAGVDEDLGAAEVESRSIGPAAAAAAAAAAAMRAAPGSGSSGPGVEPRGKVRVSDSGRGGSAVPRRGGRWGGVVAGGPKERRWQRREEGGGNGAGGSLVAYEIPEDWRMLPRFYPAPGWLRVTLASGFRVRGISINPGTPGFPYVFHPHRSMEGKHPPYIAIAGDCSQSAYVLRPAAAKQQEKAEAEAATVGSWEREAAPLSYEIACAIEVPGTVGSLAVGYGALLGENVAGGLPGEPELEPPIPPPPTMAAAAAAAAAAPLPPPSPPTSSLAEEEEEGRRRRRRQRQRNGDGWAKLFVPNYDGNKIYVFSMEPGPEL